MSATRLLIVDDETSILSALQRALRRSFGDALAVRTCDDPVAALELLRVRDFDLVVSDLRMPAMDGLSFLKRAAGLRPQLIRMVLTGSADFETAQMAINEAGVFRYICKPWRDEELAAHIGAAIARAAEAAAQRQAAQAWHDRQEQPSAEELERRRLEALEPGITHVEWGPGGEVLLPPISAFADLAPRSAAGPSGE